MRKILLALLILIGSLFFYYFYPIDKLPNNIQIDRLVVLKSKRELQVYSNSELIKTYKISLGREPVGDKEFEGDNKTPEGLYKINAKNPYSKYYKNLGISYPNNNDIIEAKKMGKRPGGDIKIHGLNNGREWVGKFQRWYDWTAGCIALTNEEIDDLYNKVKIGTPIKINP